MKKGYKSGFTIIEIVLVLAIAGLIFLMVFIGLPSLRRSQENTKRREDMARIMTAVQQYQAHNKGKLPFKVKGSSLTIDKNFIPRYVDPDCDTPATDSKSYDRLTGCGEAFTDPDGSVYSIVFDEAFESKVIKMWHRDMSSDDINDATGGDFKKHRIYIYTNAECSDDDVWRIYGARNGSRENARQFALLFTLEGDPMFCLDNS